MNSSHLSEKFYALQKTQPDIKSFAEKYPWCSFAQLSLLHQYQKNNPDEFQQQATKTALFFKNTIWLKWQLHLLSTYVEPEIIKEEIVNDKTSNIIKAEENVEPPISTAETEITNDTLVIKQSEPESAFEPLHTTDYFASQGIKITDDPVTEDKLGTQMKSFTEWLKSMKKIHKETLHAGDEQTDKKIQQMAEHSNEQAEVVTESMAEVLVKQDKKEKAIEVYNKLSLINPSKSAYFAAKIQSLSGDRQI